MMNRRQLLHLLPLAAASAAAPSFDRPFTVAIIGHTGRGNYGHGLDTMWAAVPHTEVVAIADADAKGLEGALKKVGKGKGFVDYHLMLAELKPDIVAIGPRHVDQHRDMMLAAIQHGAKGIYIEKPFCRTVEEADEVLAACKKSGTKISIAHRNRFHPAMATVKKLIEAGEIGRVLEMRGRGKEDARGGGLDLWVLGSHVLNLATYFGGAPVACNAGVYQDGKAVSKAEIKVGDEGIGLLAGTEVHARFELTAGYPMHFDSIQNAGVKEAGFGLQIIGTKGIIDFRVDKEPLAHVLKGSPFQPDGPAREWLPITTGGINVPEPILNLGKMLSSHQSAGMDLVAAIKDNRAPACDAMQGRETIEMISAVFESHRLGGQRVTLPLQTKVNPLSLF